MERCVCLLGPFQEILIPQNLGFEDTQEVGRALIAWRYRLSNDEVPLLECIAEGLTNDEIAERLGVAELNTVKNRIKAIFKKMRVNNRVQAATIAVQFGLKRELVSSKQSNE